MRRVSRIEWLKWAAPFLASTNLFALELACLNLVYAVTLTIGNNNHPLIQRIGSRSGAHVVEYVEHIGLNNRHYEIIRM